MPAHVVGVSRPKPGPAQKVIQLKAGDTIFGVILSDAVWGVGTHWNDRAGPHGRSERCTGDKGTCSGCNGQLPRRWKGYIYVYSFTSREPVFVELTPASSEALELQAPPNKTLRGEQLRMTRGSGGNKTRLSVEVSEYRGDMSILPPDKDPQEILETLWNWRR